MMWGLLVLMLLMLLMTDVVDVDYAVEECAAAEDKNAWLATCLYGDDDDDDDNDADDHDDEG